jgi:hypothetical protein
MFITTLCKTLIAIAHDFNEDNGVDVILACPPGANATCKQHIAGVGGERIRSDNGGYAGRADDLE